MGGIKRKITSWKGPITDDRQLLVPAGQAIMEGLMSGISAELPALRQLLASVTATIASLRSPASYAAPQPSMQAMAARPGSVAPTPAAATAPVINITVQERDVAGEVERVLRRILFQAGW